jgi:DNA-binding response OmpR family regulator
VKILVIDDEPEIANTFARYLQRLGHECLIALCACEGMVAISEHRPDLVITDLSLPDGNGFDLIGHSHRNLPHTPVSLVTGNYLSGMDAAARKAGAALYLQKPLNLVLREAVESVSVNYEKQASLIATRDSPMTTCRRREARGAG